MAVLYIHDDYTDASVFLHDDQFVRSMIADLMADPDVRLMANANYFENFCAGLRRRMELDMFARHEHERALCDHYSKEADAR